MDPWAKPSFPGSQKTALALAAAVIALAVVIAVALLQPWVQRPPAGIFGLPVGESAPEFTITDVNGTAWNLSAQRGSAVLIDFMGSRCSTCVSEMRRGVLQALHDRHSGNGFVMISVDIGGSLGTEDETVAWRFLRGLNPDGSERWQPGNWTIALDNEGLAQTYRVAGIPMKYLIDREGRVAWVWPPGLVSFDELDARVRAALG